MNFLKNINCPNNEKRAFFREEVSQDFVQNFPHHRNKIHFCVSKLTEAFMSKFTNPLDSVRIASPCSANWNEMYGNVRKRYCSECKLNVYNLSEMTQREAENFLINSEGRVCVKFYRRSDGSVLTKDCPVGWQALKRKVSRAATAVFALIAGFFSGNFIFNQTTFDNADLIKKVTVDSDTSKEDFSMPIPGQLENLDELKVQIKKKHNSKKMKRIVPKTKEMVLGRVENIRQLKDEPVKLWIK